MSECLLIGMTAPIPKGENREPSFHQQCLLDVQITDVALDNMPKAPVKVMMNVGNPELAFSFANLPSEGIGLA